MFHVSREEGSVPGYRLQNRADGKCIYCLYNGFADFSIFKRDLVISGKTYDLLFERLRREVIPGETKHLIVLLGVPVAYPRLVWLETLYVPFMHPDVAISLLKGGSF